MPSDFRQEVESVVAVSGNRVWVAALFRSGLCTAFDNYEMMMIKDIVICLNKGETP